MPIFYLLSFFCHASAAWLIIADSHLLHMQIIFFLALATFFPINFSDFFIAFVQIEDVCILLFVARTHIWHWHLDIVNYTNGHFLLMHQMSSLGVVSMWAACAKGWTMQAAGKKSLYTRRICNWYSRRYSDSYLALHIHLGIFIKIYKVL